MRSSMNVQPLRSHVPLILLVTFFLIIGVLTVYDYGITWDEPRNYHRGRVALNVLMFRDLSFYDHPQSLRIPSAIPFSSHSMFEAYPSFSSTVASFFSYVFAENIRVFHPVAAHQMVIIAFGALGIVAVYFLALDLGTSRKAAFVSALILAITPLYLGHTHVNIKDIPGASMFALSTLMILKALQKGSISKTLTAGIVFGLAAATKLSSIFALPMVAIWYVCTYQVYTRKKLLVRFLSACALIAIVSCIVFLFSWPWLLENPVANLLSAYKYASQVGQGLPTILAGVRTKVGPLAAPYYGLAYTLVNNSESVLCMTILGFTLTVYAVSKKINKSRLLTLPFWWIVFTFARYVVFEITIYNGVRHILEILAALALSCGIAFHLLEYFHAKYTSYVLGVLAYGLSAIAILQYLYADIRLHPYQMLYFNRTSGGLQYAANHYEFDYWGFSVNEMIRYLNTLPDRKTVTASVNWIDPKSEYFPGNEITIVPSDEKAQYIIIPNSTNYFAGAIRYWKRNGILMYTVERDEAPIGYIFKTSK